MHAAKHAPCFHIKIFKRKKKEMTESKHCCDECCNKEHTEGESLYGEVRDGQLYDVFSIDDIIDYGCFDGSIPELHKITSAVSYMFPVTWEIKLNKNNDIKRVMFFDRDKLDMMNEGIEPSKKEAVAHIKTGSCWVTYKRVGELGVESGFQQISKEELECIKNATVLTTIVNVAFNQSKEDEDE